ncbi:MAG TPA: FAD:protein FMN transferase [Methylomirabilota bacterium]
MRRAQPLLGTFVEITASGAPPEVLHAAIGRAFGTVADVHHLMSFHEGDSDVSRLNREAATRPVRVHPWTYEVLRVASELYEASGGLFDIAIADALQRLGFLPRVGADRPVTAGARSPEQPVELLPRDRVRFTRHDVRIDLGGIAKGFAVDRAVETLRTCRVPRGLVNAGGDVAAFGPEPYRVDVRDPRHPGRILLRVQIRGEAIASSGHAFDRVAGGAAIAIVDPGTGRPASAVRGASVRAPSCVIADALTKLVVLAEQSADALLARYGASALLVPCRGDILMSHTWARGVRSAS